MTRRRENGNIATNPDAASLSHEREEMLETLRRGGVTSASVLHAMAAVPREEFVRPQDRPDAYSDRALPIGFQQTISQPLMVAIIVEALELQAGDNVLDIGTGSGYQAAVIAACGGVVTGIERIDELAETASRRLQKLGYDITVRTGDGSYGAPDAAPFTAIAVAAAVPQLPHTLISQLAEGGHLVVPVSTQRGLDNLYRVTKRGDHGDIEDLGPCRFVPLIGDEGFDD